MKKTAHQKNEEKKNGAKPSQSLPAMKRNKTDSKKSKKN